jgi:aryl carrier-like protein
MTEKARLIALGGATEGGIWSNCYETLRTVDYASFGRIPYGLALPGQTMMVLDFLQRVCPLSVVGTIYIGGHSLASGYWHDPERTAKSFVSHPITGERLYNTGDMGRYMDADGTIDILGRVSQMETSGWIKVRGVRVNPDMITSALLLDPQVVNATVVRAVFTAGQDELVAVVVPRASHAAKDIGATESDDNLLLLPVDASFVFAALRSRFPLNLMPAWVLFVREIPLTSNGKVDLRTVLQWVAAGQHNAQLQLDPDADTGAGEGASAASAMELLIGHTIQKHLELPAQAQLAVTERYANWGLNSMNGIYLVEKLRLLGVDVAIDQVMQAGTVRALARSARWNGAVHPAQGYRVPLTPFQAVAILAQPRRHVFVLPQTSRVTAVELAQQLLQRFSILRAEWVHRDSELYCHVPPLDGSVHSSSNNVHALVRLEASDEHTLALTASPAILDGPAWAVVAAYAERESSGREKDAGEREDDDVPWPCWLAGRRLSSVLALHDQSVPPPSLSTFRVESMRVVATDALCIGAATLAASGLQPLDVAWERLSQALVQYKTRVAVVRAVYAPWQPLQTLGPSVVISSATKETCEVDTPAAPLNVLVLLSARPIPASLSPDVFSMADVVGCTVELLVTPVANARTNTNEVVFTVTARVNAAMEDASSVDQMLQSVLAAACCPESLEGTLTPSKLLVCACLSLLRIFSLGSFLTFYLVEARDCNTGNDAGPCVGGRVCAASDVQVFEPDWDHRHCIDGASLAVC